MPYSSSLALWTQVKSKEGEHMFLASTNFLQDGIDKDHVHFNRGDYMFVGKDTLQIWICGHILPHDIVHSHYFRKIVCLHDVQDRLQVQSTSRMTFRQEGEDDEDMTTMHTTMLGESHGGPKHIRFESPRWRPK